MQTVTCGCCNNTYVFAKLKTNFCTGTCYTKNGASVCSDYNYEDNDFQYIYSEKSGRCETLDNCVGDNCLCCSISQKAKLRPCVCDGDAEIIGAGVCKDIPFVYTCGEGRKPATCYGSKVSPGTWERGVCNPDTCYFDYSCKRSACGDGDCVGSSPQIKCCVKAIPTGCVADCTGDNCGQSDGCGGLCPSTDLNTCGKCGNPVCDGVS